MTDLNREPTAEEIAEDDRIEAEAWFEEAADATLRNAVRTFEARTAFAKGRIVIEGDEAFEIVGAPAHADDFDLNVIEADLTLTDEGYAADRATVASLHVGIPDVGVFGLEMTRGDLAGLRDALTALVEGRCAYCNEPMAVTVRGHHHTEDGVDVTRAVYRSEPDPNP